MQLAAALVVLGTFGLVASATDSWKCGVACQPGWNEYNPCQTLCVGDDCNPIQEYINATLIALDVAYVYTPDDPDYDYTVMAPPGCCNKCKDTNWCNAWTSCNKLEGCGSGCLKAVKGRAPASGDTPLPILSYSSGVSCAGDKFPYGSCQLKRLHACNLENPLLLKNGGAQGWVSGTVPKVRLSGCPLGFSKKNCDMCKASKDAAVCNTCVQKVNKLKTIELCPVCAALPTASLQNKCITCLRGDGGVNGTAGCADCARLTNPADILSCFECALRAPKPASTSSACPECFNTYLLDTKVGGIGTLKCLSCVSTGNTGYGAFLPPGTRDSCSDCGAKDVNDKPGCFKCAANYKDNAHAVMCALCATTLYEPDHPACYSCLQQVKAIDPRSRCLNARSSKPLNKEFVACLAKAKTYYNAAGCVGCWSLASQSVDNTKNCFRCANNAKNNDAPELCPGCWTTSYKKSRTVCEACINNKTVIDHSQCTVA